MFLSEFDFKLDYAPGKKNPADRPSRHPDFAPQEGDEVIKIQNKALLTKEHLECLFPHIYPSLSNISSLSTFVVNDSELLDKFKMAFHTDTEWCKAISKSDDSFSFSGNLVFHDNQLFVPLILRSEIIHSHHDSVLAGHPG